MKTLIPFFLLVFLSFTILFSGCSPDEEFGADPIGSLSFSTDTLSFDTVFSKLSTPTAWLTIHNNGSKKIRISGISLKEGGSNGFRINIDGVSAKSFSDVEIPVKDSLFLFVALTPIEQGSGQPFFISDALIFQAEGIKKQIVLEAYSLDAVTWHGKIIQSDTTLTADKPYHIYDSLVVAKNATLTIREGVTLYFHNKAKVVVHGKINAVGSASAPITLRGDRLDEILPGFLYDVYPGQWESVRLSESSFENILDYVHIRGANSGIIADSSSSELFKLKMTNSIIHNMTENCIWSCNNKMTVANSQLTNSGSNTVCLIGGMYDFTHCTLANYQDMVESRSGSTLFLCNYFQKINYPLQAAFYNSIVFGSNASEVDTLMSSQSTWNIQFKNCMLRSLEWPSSIATSCVYPKEPKFLKIDYDTEKFDFRLDSVSEARFAADSAYSKLYPYDMNGINRLENEKPDIGAYEWITGQK